MIGVVKEEVRTLISELEFEEFKHSATPTLLNDPKYIYLVVKGGVDLFFATTKNKKVAGRKTHIARVNEAQLLFGHSTHGQNHAMCFVCLPNTQLIKISANQLSSLNTTAHKVVCEAIEYWLDILHLPLCSSNHSGNKLTSTSECLIHEQGAVSCIDKPVIVKFEPAPEQLMFCGFDYALKEKSDFVFISNDVFIKPEREVKLEIDSIASFISQYDYIDAITSHNTSLANIYAQFFCQLDEKDTARIFKQEEMQKRAFDASLRSFSNLFNGTDKVKHSKYNNPLLDVCDFIATQQKLPFKVSQALLELGDELKVSDIETSFGWRSRRVLLRGNWWTADHGTLLAFVEESRKPVALIYSSNKGYQAYDVESGKLIKVKEEFAASLQVEASVFYRPFPDRKLNFFDVFRFGMQGGSKDVIVVMLIGALGAIIGLLPPIAMGELVDTIIPEADRHQLYFIMAALITLALANGMFLITRAIATLRFQSRIDHAIQSAVWDRVLALPVPFFHRYSAGELASRANGITQIIGAVSGTTSSAIISGVFSVFYFFLLFYYSSNLAWLATLIVTVTVAVNISINYITIKPLRELIKNANKSASLTNQLLSGIAKLRNTGAETRAFVKWSDLFFDSVSLTFRAENIKNILTTYNSVLPLISSIAIFSIIVWNEESISVGEFMAFTAAYASFLAGMLGLAEAFITVLSVVPTYENTKPILESVPERSLDKRSIARLSGDIEICNVSFKYEENAPYVLQDINLSIKAGEYVALVGGSGSGKSTLLKLLLGFQLANKGNIFFDGTDINTVDISSIRRQIGVVLQSGRLMAGDVFTNIVGSSSLTIKDAWEAARKCGLDEDIKKMPMGMHTLVSDGVMSGGQVQRILIARAIVHQPNMLFFDEATSALDNKTQAMVTKSLDELNVTRIVIAHRLSTIKNADRILYMHKGKIVEDGTYDELISLNGYFAELAKRQKV
ncbi:NHLP bacteriocin export ABC transporter permease/ATPase subunit [Catenovulum sediminis]|uniref:NHLP bacteriocin export ABC transporter permease/ATPase subunit n=1 Tax=Catenovulum sediminis TaxID=1740262 RepID=A0ABV1RI98_9ALTE